MNRTVPMLIVSALIASTTTAFGETINCTAITSLPATITTQGIYCLTGNLSTASSGGITIAANNVTLDLNGWKVGGQAAGKGTGALGISSVYSNVTVRNGIVRGFYAGVYLTGHGALVEDLLVDQNTYIGVYVQGQGSIVRNNQIVDTGGSTIATNFPAYPIYVTGQGSVIEGNVVSGLTAAGNAIETGIFIHDSADQSVVRRNIVSDGAKPTGGGNSTGIDVAASDVIVVGNAVTNFNFGIYYYSTASGTYSQNVVVNCGNPYGGYGTAGSDND
jgi:hypothetical protein